MRSNKKPEIYNTLNKKFGVEWNKGIIITYGNTIHCKYKISREKYVHEKVHSKQQKKYGIKKWWKEYLKSSKFRLSQELEAYKREIEFINETIRDIHKRERMKQQILYDISSSIYGNIITQKEAAKLLRINL